MYSLLLRPRKTYYKGTQFARKHWQGEDRYSMYLGSILCGKAHVHQKGLELSSQCRLSDPLNQNPQDCSLRSCIWKKHPNGWFWGRVKLEDPYSEVYSYNAVLYNFPIDILWPWRHALSSLWTDVTPHSIFFSPKTRRELVHRMQRKCSQNTAYYIKASKRTEKLVSLNDTLTKIWTGPNNSITKLHMGLKLNKNILHVFIPNWL